MRTYKIKNKRQRGDRKYPNTSQIKGNPRKERKRRKRETKAKEPGAETLKICWVTQLGTKRILKEQKQSEYYCIQG